jgi:two-component system response regulator HydG
MIAKPWIGVSDAHQRLVALIDRVAPADVELLFHGETGVGKKQYARYAHDKSSRRDAPFVAVNCGAITEEKRWSP